MTPYFETELGKLYHGDCLEIMPMLEPVDLVFTDPPYPKEFLHCYNHLGCVEIKPGRFLFVYSGQTYLPETIKRLSINLEYVWCVSILHAQSQIVWGRRAIAQWKPMLVYKSPGDFKYKNLIQDVVGAVGQSKCYHKWGQAQAESMKYIETFSDETGIILDPFCGGGATIETCERLNRRWIGIEIEEKYCEIAAKRIEKENQQLKLFT